MQTPLQITFHGMDPSESVEQKIREKAERLNRYAERITGCHVTVEAPHKHHHKGQLYSVRVELHVPNGDIVVNRESHQNHAHEDVYVAVRDAFDAALRQLEGHIQKRKDKARRPSEGASGPSS